MRIDIYVVTDTKYLKLSEDFCEECNIFVRNAKKAVEEKEIEVNVHSWWTNPQIILKGGYHPPVMTYNGKIITQGEEIPTVDEIKQFIQVGAENPSF